MADLFTVTPDGGRRVRLSSPIKSHSLEILHLDFRPIRWPDYMAVGEPLIEGMTAGGVFVVEPVIERIRQYAERLLGEDQEEYLAQLCLNDAYKVQAAIRSFFDQARAQGRAPSELSPSSSDTASGQPTSRS